MRYGRRSAIHAKTINASSIGLDVVGRVDSFVAMEVSLKIQIERSGDRKSTLCEIIQPVLSYSLYQIDHNLGKLYVSSIYIYLEEWSKIRWI